jgi:Fe-S-cluster containining protein
MMMHEHADRWFASAMRSEIAGKLEGVYGRLAQEVATRGPACWASGRCCNFAKTGHLLYVTGLEAAYTLARLTSAQRGVLTGAESGDALASGRDACVFQSGNLCGVHAVRPMGCRMYFCDRGAQQWQHEMYEVFQGEIRGIHEAHDVPYVYAEWRGLITSLGRWPGLA